MTVLLAAGLVLAAYLLGSVPTGLLVGKRMGVDVRTRGSGNIGATNVARTVGKKVGVLVLLLDALKGAVPVAAWQVFDLGGRVPVGPYLYTAVGLAPIVGHCFPVWLRFRGGKGVATALGVFLVVDPLPVAIAATLFALVYAAFRVVSLGSLTAAIAVPTAAALLGRPLPVLFIAIGGAAIIVVKHQANIRRLLRRSELKV